MAMTASMAMEASKQNSMGNYSKANNDLRLASEFENIAMKSFSEMAKRFKATSATQNSQFILTKLDDGVGLVKINKDTGEKELEVLLKDKNPEYTVDERGGVLYYQSQSQFLDAFDLK